MYKVEFEVRDSEIDAQGVVNNANYFKYMEHARHKFLIEEMGLDFAQMTKDNQNLFLTSVAIEFKKSLKSKDKFYVTCKVTHHGKLRVSFEQEVRLLVNNDLMAKGINIGVCINGHTGKPYIPERFTYFFNKHHEILM